MSEHIRAGKPPAGVGIGEMACFLKCHERTGNLLKVWRNGCSGDDREMGRQLAAGEDLTSLLHLRMAERPGDQVPKFGARHHTAYGFPDQEMKQCVVGGRNSPAETRLLRPPRLPPGQMFGLLQQVSGEAHSTTQG